MKLFKRNKKSRYFSFSSLLFFVGPLFLLFSCASFKLEEVKREKELILAWAHNLDNPQSSTGNQFIALNWPLLTEKNLYIGTSFGQMYAYNIQDGGILWKSADGANQHAAPLSYKGQVIYGTVEGTLYSRDAFTGKLKYRVDLKAPVETQGVLYQGRILFSLRNHEILCLDPETGKILWSYKRPYAFLTTLQRMAPLETYTTKNSHFLLAGFADGYLVSLSLEDGLVSWETRISDASSKLSDVDIKSQVIANRIYTGAMGQALKILSLEGKVIRSLDLYPSRSPLPLEGDRLLVPQINGVLALLNTSSLEVLGQVTLSQGLPLTNVLYWKTKTRNSYVVGSSSGELFFLNPVSLNVEKKILLGHDNSAIYGDIVSLGEYLAIFSSRSRLYVYR